MNYGADSNKRAESLREKSRKAKKVPEEYTDYRFYRQEEIRCETAQANKQLQELFDRYQTG